MVDNDMEIVILYKEEGTPLGISITGGKGASTGDFPILVNKIVDNSIAARNGSLQNGDQIFSINGVSLADATLNATVDMLRKAVSKVELTIIRDGFNKFKAKRATEAVLSSTVHVVSNILPASSATPEPFNPAASA